jgi:hypothetical protein
LRTSYAGAVWAMRRWFAHNAPLAKKMDCLLKDIYRTFGLRTRMIAPIMGRILLVTMRREERRLARGWTYEPKTFYEKNPAAQALESAAAPDQISSATGAARVVHPAPAACRGLF